MKIKINGINEQNKDVMIDALDKYINKLRKEMIDLDRITISDEEIKEEIINSINDNNDIVNSYIENNLNVFKETLIEYSEKKKKNNE